MTVAGTRYSEITFNDRAMIFLIYASTLLASNLYSLSNRFNSISRASLSDGRGAFSLAICPFLSKSKYLGIPFMFNSVESSECSLPEIKRPVSFLKSGCSREPKVISGTPFTVCRQPCTAFINTPKSSTYPLAIAPPGTMYPPDFPDHHDL